MGFVRWFVAGARWVAPVHPRWRAHYRAVWQIVTRRHPAYQRQGGRLPTSGVWSVVFRTHPAYRKGPDA